MLRLLATGCTLVLTACAFQLDGVNIAGDGGVSADASMAPDMTYLIPGFQPAHVTASEIVLGAASLTTVHDIDTGNLTIDGAAPPPGVIFAQSSQNDAWAVLSVKDFAVMNDVTVHGLRALIVVAVGTIDIAATLHGEAKQRTPGPGGNYTGPGVAFDGKSNGLNDSGGGGAGHATVGANGGDSDAVINQQGGGGGSTYSAELAAGSGGGEGAGDDGTLGLDACPTTTDYSVGGAGGGTIQLSARESLTIEQTGGINVGGGGGSPGCGLAASAGGGGGSGGAVWLEAPNMTILGIIAANGGGGGSGGYNDVINKTDGAVGVDATLDATPASGGTATTSNGGAGGAGGAGAITPVAGATGTNGGGGGGAVGQINIRTHNVSPITASSTLISPAPTKTTDF